MGNGWPKGTLGYRLRSSNGNWVLTGVWLVGGAVMEFLHISLWAEIALVAVLLGVVLVVELVFFRWNEGRWPAVTAGRRTSRTPGLAELGTNAGQRDRTYCRFLCTGCWPTDGT